MGIILVLSQDFTVVTEEDSLEKMEFKLKQRNQRDNQI